MKPKINIHIMLITYDHSVHDPAKRPELRQLEHLVMGNIRQFQIEGDNNTEGRTSIRDILTTPPPPPSIPPSPNAASSSSILAGVAGGDPAQVFFGPGFAADAGNPRQQRPGRSRDAIRAVRNVFRGGGGLPTIARRAGRNIRRVFRGAVRRVTGAPELRQTQIGSATIVRPAAQQTRSRESSMAELQRAMASVGLVIPQSMALDRQRAS